MIKWIPKVLALLVMIPVLMIGFIGALFYNGLLLMDLLLQWVKRKHK